MVTVKCEVCGKFLEIPEEYRGQTGKCNACGTALVVPKSSVKPVPKWKIGCLNTCAVLAMVFVVIGIFAPKPPASVADAPEPVAPVVPKPKLAPVAPAPPKVLSLEEKITEAIGQCNRENAPSLVVTDASNYISVKFPVSDNLTNSFVVGGAQMDTMKILEVVNKERPGFSVSIEGTFGLVDLYGNSAEETVFSCTYSGNTIARINFDSIPHDNAWKIADYATIHPSLR